MPGYSKWHHEGEHCETDQLSNSLPHTKCRHHRHCTLRSQRRRDDRVPFTELSIQQRELMNRDAKQDSSGVLEDNGIHRYYPPEDRL